MVSVCIHLLISKKTDMVKLMTKWWLYLCLLFFLLISLRIGLFETLLIYFKNGGFSGNNLWYYHSFLWREYGLITFLSIAGLLTAVSNKNKYVNLFVIYIFLHLAFIFFVFKPYTSRYILPIY